MQYLTRTLAELPYDVGTTESDGSRSSDGREGYLSYGPYIALGPGRYFGGFHVRRTGTAEPSQAATVDIAADDGGAVIAARSVPADELLLDLAGLIGLEFSVDGPWNSFELRLHTTAGLALNATQLKLFRIDN